MSESQRRPDHLRDFREGGLNKKLESKDALVDYAVNGSYDWLAFLEVTEAFTVAAAGGGQARKLGNSGLDDLTTALRNRRVTTKLDAIPETETNNITREIERMRKLLGTIEGNRNKATQFRKGTPLAELILELKTHVNRRVALPSVLTILGTPETTKSHSGFRAYSTAHTELIAVLLAEMESPEDEFVTADMALSKMTDLPQIPGITDYLRDRFEGDSVLQMIRSAHPDEHFFRFMKLVAQMPKGDILWQGIVEHLGIRAIPIDPDLDFSELRRMTYAPKKLNMQVRMAELAVGAKLVPSQEYLALHESHDHHFRAMLTGLSADNIVLLADSIYNAMANTVAIDQFLAPDQQPDEVMNANRYYRAALTEQSGTGNYHRAYATLHRTVIHEWLRSHLPEIVEDWNRRFNTVQGRHLTEQFASVVETDLAEVHGRQLREHMDSVLGTKYQEWLLVNSGQFRDIVQRTWRTTKRVYWPSSEEPIHFSFADKKIEFFDRTGFTGVTFFTSGFEDTVGFKITLNKPPFAVAGAVDASGHIEQSSIKLSPASQTLFELMISESFNAYVKKEVIIRPRGKRQTQPQQPDRQPGTSSPIEVRVPRRTIFKYGDLEEQIDKAADTTVPPRESERKPPRRFREARQLALPYARRYQDALIHYNRFMQEYDRAVDEGPIERVRALASEVARWEGLAKHYRDLMSRFHPSEDKVKKNKKLPVPFQLEEVIDPFDGLKRVVNTWHKENFWPALKPGEEENLSFIHREYFLAGPGLDMFKYLTSKMVTEVSEEVRE